MCFTPGMSAVLVTVGCVGSLLAWRNCKHRRDGTHYLFVFYTLMELLQLSQFGSVNQCGTLANRALVEVAYVLVLVQPLMWNVVLHARVASHRRIAFMLGMVQAGIWIVVNVASRVPTWFRTHRLLSDIMCDETACTFRGDGHLYWQWPFADFRGLNANWLMYLVTWFLPALLVAETRPTGVVLVLGASAAVGAMHTYASHPRSSRRCGASSASR